MDWYPLFNSLRIAMLATALVFFLGLGAAYYIARLPRACKAVLDVVLTLPLVLPPTVVGYFLLCLVGPRRPLGAWLATVGVQIVMSWPGAVLASAVVAFPLMYRTARGALEAFDPNLKYAGQTLGLSNTYIFWHITLPVCKTVYVLVQCLHLRAHWASTAQPVWSLGISQAGRRPSRPQSINCGEPETMQEHFAG